MEIQSKFKMLAGSIAVGIIAIAFFIWPTPYSYGTTTNQFWRVHRIYGVKEVATADGWQNIEEYELVQKARRDRIDEELAETIAVRKTGRSLDNVELGNVKKSTLFSRIRFYNEKMSYQLTIKPLDNQIEQAFRIHKNSVITVILLTESGFELKRFDPENCNLTVDGKGGYESIECAGDLSVSEDTYDQISTLSASWAW
jgi:hypothetical protein